MRLAGAFLWDGALVCPLCVVPVPYTCRTLTLRRNPQLRMMSLSLGLGDPAVPLSALLNMGGNGGDGGVHRGIHRNTASLNDSVCSFDDVFAVT